MADILLFPESGGVPPVPVIGPGGILSIDTSGVTVIVDATAAPDGYLLAVNSALVPPFEYVAPSGGGGGAPVAVTTGPVPYGDTEYSEIIVAASVTPASVIMVSWGFCTDDDENSPRTEDVQFMAEPLTGQFRLHILSQEPIGGPFKINYLVG